MTVHMQDQPDPAAVHAAHAAASTAPAGGSLPATSQTQTGKIRALAVLLALMTALAAGLAALVVGSQVTESAADPIIWAAVTFVTVSGLVILIEEKVGLFA
ncbi:hypothetical protein ACWGIN_31670 [Streptomyces sp. NPDC054861]